MSTRLNFLVCLLLFSATGLLANNRYGLPIVPKPQQEIITGENIAFDNEWEVYVDSEAKEASAYITSVLKECGVQARFTARKNNADLILDIHKKISRNPEAYQLSVTDRKSVV